MSSDLDPLTLIDGSIDAALTQSELAEAEIYASLQETYQSGVDQVSGVSADLYAWIDTTMFRALELIGEFEHGITAELNQTVTTGRLLVAQCPPIPDLPGGTEAPLPAFVGSLTTPPGITLAPGPEDEGDGIPPGQGPVTPAPLVSPPVPPESTAATGGPEVVCPPDVEEAPEPGDDVMVAGACTAQLHALGGPVAEGTMQTVQWMDSDAFDPFFGRIKSFLGPLAPSYWGAETADEMFGSASEMDIKELEWPVPSPSSVP